MQTCYRHPTRETGVSCSSCGRPICPDCMTSTPVGMRCPECSKQTTQVRRLKTTPDPPVVTYVIIALCVLTYFGTRSSPQVGNDLALVGLGLDRIPPERVGVSEGEYWRLITSGFMHGGVIHLLFNMYVLYWLGTMLEPDFGRVRFVALYFASMLAGSFGALLLTPNSFTVGASGAVFGLMAAAFVTQRARGIDPMQSGIGPVILLNLGITFVIPNISIGGHIGGLVGGAIAAWAMDHVSARRNGTPLAVAVCVVVGVAAVAGAIAVAGR